MYIRTECGKIQNIVSNNNNYWFKTKYGETRMKLDIDNKLTFVSKDFKIKSQGDNLIDVLEEKDIVYYNYNKGDWFAIGIISIVPYKGDLIKFRNGLLETKYKNQYKILSVITHEQYEPLKQEVK
jgi:hypothetical protein